MNELENLHEDENLCGDFFLAHRYVSSSFGEAKKQSLVSNIEIQMIECLFLVIAIKKIIVDRFEHVSSYQYQTVTGE